MKIELEDETIQIVFVATAILIGGSLLINGCNRDQELTNEINIKQIEMKQEGK